MYNTYPAKFTNEIFTFLILILSPKSFSHIPVLNIAISDLVLYSAPCLCMGAIGLCQNFCRSAVLFIADFWGYL